MIHLIYMVTLGVSFVFIGLNHPITLGMILIVHTGLIGLATGVLAGNFWFSYILFLVFLGGVLVLFIYMTSLASNEKFNFSWGDFLVLGVFVVSLLGALMFLMGPSSGVFDQSLGWALNTKFLTTHCFMMLKLYSSYSYEITLFLIFYLLYALVVCANLVGGYPGALRNFN